MPRLSLYKPERGQDYKFMDRQISEMFQVGGTDVYLHKYLGPKIASEGTADQPIYRDELKLNGPNADILAEQEGKQDNPFKTKHQEANDKFLGYKSGYYSSDDSMGMSKTFNDQYLLDVIGTSHCRSRTIACTKDEYQRLEQWRVAKGNLVSTHQTWIDSIQKQCEQLKIGLKAYRYLSEAVELATELGIQVDEAELIRTNSTGLTIYNPSNLASMIKGMKNKHQSREAKILARKQYEASQIN